MAKLINTLENGIILERTGNGLAPNIIRFSQRPIKSYESHIRHGKKTWKGGKRLKRPMPKQKGENWPMIRSVLRDT